ncbi:hypothetical protein OAQ84_00130 [Bdellovibrionales bacterium]|nr:hypothetical protein [Bdellovibrionales bacterium]
MRICISFAQAVFLTKWLGIEKYGDANLIFSYVAFLHYLFILGFDSTIPYFLSNQPQANKKQQLNLLLTSIFSSLFISSFILILLIVGAKDMLSDHEKSALLIPGIILGSQMEIGAISYIVSGYLRGKKIFLQVIFKEQILFPITLLIATAIFIKYFHFELLGFSLSHATASAISLLYAIWSLKKVVYHKAPLSPLSTKQQVNKFHNNFNRLKYSLPVGFMASLEPLFNYSFIAIAGAYISSTQVGYLSIGLKISFITNLFLLALAPIFMPHLSDLWFSGALKSTEKLYQNLLLTCSKWAILSTFAILTLQEETLSLFSANNPTSASILIVMTIGLSFEGAFGATKLTLVMLGNNKINVTNYLIMLPVSSLLVLWGSKNYGALGACVGFGISTVTLNMIRLFELFWIYKIKPFKLLEVTKLLVSLLLLTAVSVSTYDLGYLSSIKLPLTISMLLFFGIYFFLDDRKILTKIKTKKGM